MKDYYAILGLQKNAGEAAIRKAYRTLAKKYHPDINKMPDAHEKFIEITEAYEFLIRHHNQYNKAYKTSVDNADETATEDTFKRYSNEAREKAKRQARMRYEEFRKQHEAFQESGINDLAILFKLIFRIVIIPAIMVLVALPFYLAFTAEWQLIFLLIVTWPFAFILVWYIHDNLDHYFVPGEWYYTPQRIKQIFTQVYPTEQQCFYAPDKNADSKPYKAELLKLKDIKVGSEGFRQHHVNYINETKKILIPRSRKALIIHTINSLIKILSIIGCMVFLDISAWAWRFIFGILTGGLLSGLILLITHTRSNISYLYNYNTIIRACIWITGILLVSHIRFHPFNIIPTNLTVFVVMSIILFDCFIMQLINFLLGSQRAAKPIVRQYSEISQAIEKGYRVYNDVIIISVVYPVFKWIFG